MADKIIVHAKVHAWGEGFNDSFDIYVRKDNALYNICFAFPGYEEEQRVCGITKYEIFPEIMGALSYAYRISDPEQMNISWEYEEVS